MHAVLTNLPIFCVGCILTIYGQNAGPEQVLLNGFICTAVSALYGLCVYRICEFPIYNCLELCLISN